MPDVKAPPSGPTPLPPAPLTPGPAVVNTLAPPGLAVRIDADYDRTGSLDAADVEREARVLRPGAIILPNLDISDPARVPVPAPPAPDADLKSLLDMKDSDINGPDDESQFTEAKLAFPSGIASRATSIVVRINAKDAARIRAFQLASLGALAFAPVVVLGDSSTEMAVGGLSISALDIKLLFEALTLAGDPTLPAPTGPSPPKPPTFKARFPPGSSGAPVFAKRTPGDVWVEVVHKDAAGADIDRPRDVALFTIAPLLLLCGIQPAKRVFVVNVKDTVSRGVVLAGNQNFVFDLMEGCQGVFGSAITLPLTPSTPPVPSTRADTGPFYLIDGDKFGNDPWIQDEMEVGYCFAPHAAMHVVLHCKRNRGLDDFVHKELPAPKVGLYDGVHAPDDQSDSVHYGGNIEATPPVSKATPALGAGAAGPAVKAHKAAPFGKILLGDSRKRPVDSDFRKLLLAQRVQPVLPVDTSWLAVGHVDEFTSFVADGSPKGFKFLSASINAMTVLLEESKKVSVASGRTNFHRGKWNDRRKRSRNDYEEKSVEQFLSEAKKFNDTIRAGTLVPIDQRLKAGLALTEADIVRIPTYFTPPVVPRPPAPPAARPADSGTVALNVGMVNMLVVGAHLMIPKPFGPRMKVADAEAVLKRTFARLSIKSPLVTPPTGDVRWAEPGDTVERVVCYYTDAGSNAERDNIIDHIGDARQPLSAANTVRVMARVAEIALAPDNLSNGFLVSLLSSFSAGGLGASPAPTFTIWSRIALPDDKVDVVEAYMRSVLDPLGVTIHFVDDWFYHSSMGEAHCATNAIRQMPEDNEKKRWWDKYDPSLDVDYSP